MTAEFPIVEQAVQAERTKEGASAICSRRLIKSGPRLAPTIPDIKKGDVNCPVSAITFMIRKELKVSRLDNLNFQAIITINR